MKESSHRPLRICFPFADRAREVGGSHISALSLIKGLDRKRYEPVVMLMGQEGRVGEMFRNAGLPVERILPEARAESSLAVPKLLRSAVHHLREGQFDIVHTNEGFMHVMWGLAARAVGAAQVWHHRGNPKAKGVRWVAPLTASKVISVSQFAAPPAAPYSAAGRCSVIHSPFDLAIAQIARSEARGQALAELELPESVALVGFFGHFSDRKRPLMFIDAIAEAREQAPDLEIHGLMFGEEHDHGLHAAMAGEIRKHGLQSRIHLMGFRKPAEPWLAACDALLVPAVEEPFGRTLIEAMLLGTPVVAAASGGNIEAIDDGRTGVLAQADNPESLAQGLLSVLCNPELAQAISAEARRDALEKFGIETHVRGVEAVYDRIRAERHVQ